MCTGTACCRSRPSLLRRYWRQPLRKPRNAAHCGAKRAAGVLLACCWRASGASSARPGPRGAPGRVKIASAGRLSTAADLSQVR